MCHYTTKPYIFLLVIGLLLSVQPVMAAGGENLIVAQNEKTGQKDNPPKTQKEKSKEESKDNSKKKQEGDSQKDPKGNSTDCPDMAKPSCD